MSIFLVSKREFISKHLIFCNLLYFLNNGHILQPSDEFVLARKRTLNFCPEIFVRFYPTVETISILLVHIVGLGFVVSYV